MMKKLLGIFSVVLILISSCTEFLPVRVFQSIIQDTTYIAPTVSTAQTRIVLFEEFTGASCVNCPDGKDKLDEILNAYPGRLAVVGLHTGSLSEPAHEGDPDFRTSYSDEIAAAFGMTSMPSGMINRKEFGGNIIQGRLDWKTRVESILNSAPKVNIFDTSYIDPKTDSTILELKIEILEDLTGELNYSIYLTESGIIAAQKNGNTYIDHYDHEHVLRKMYTNSNGNSLKKLSGNTTYPKGQVFSKKFFLGGLASSWKKENMHVVTSVSDATSKEVLQTSEIKY